MLSKEWGYMMLTVVELTDSELPQEFIDILPTHCDTCGAETVITETLTILKCPNKQCLEKSVHRLVALLKDMGVKNMGESKCRKFLEHFEITNPYGILMYESEHNGALYEGCGLPFSESIVEQLNRSRKMLLWEYVKIGNLPGIRDSARKLLSDYDNLEEFYDDLEAGGISFVQELLSITGKSDSISDVLQDTVDSSFVTEGVSVTAVDVYNTLIHFKEDLFDGLPYVDIKQLDTPVLNICISTAVGKPFTSKPDFVLKMNEEFGSKVHLNFLGSVTKDCQFLIWSKEGAETSKVAKAYRYNQKQLEYNQENGIDEDEGMIQVMTGLEFKEYLESI